MKKFDPPEDLLLEILSRLPVESLLRFKRVSKSWCDLIGSRYFSLMKLNRFSQRDSNSKIIVRARTFKEVKSRLYIIDCATNDVKMLDYPPLKYNKKIGVKLLGSINGVICLLYAYKKIVIWNPFSHNYHVVGPMSSGSSSFREHGGAYGFAYEKTTNDYKVVSLTTNKSSYNTVSYHGWIYSLKLKKWKTLENFSYVLEAEDSIFVNGALHWITQDNMILSFDLVDETFHIMSLPNTKNGDRVYVKNVGILGDCLSLTMYASVREIWVMKVYGVHDSWTRIYMESESRSYGLRHLFIRPISYLKSNKQVIIHDSQEHLYLYDLEKQSIELLASSQHNNLDTYHKVYPSAYPFIESLECCDFSRDETLRKSSRRKRTRVGDTDDSKLLAPLNGIEVVKTEF